MSPDLLEPSGPHRSLRPRSPVRPTVYRVAPDAQPRRIRRDDDGNLVGEVLLVPDEPSGPHNSLRTRYLSLDALAAHQEAATPRARPRAVPDLDGHDQRPDPLRATTPAEFVAAMRRYREWAGDFSYRDLQHHCGGVCAASSFHAALNRDRLPRLTVLNAFIVACGGDEAEYRRWVTAWRRLRLDSAPPPTE